MRTHSLVPAIRTASAFAVAMLLWSSVSIAATYRWVDKDGVVHYSDRPAPGAQEVQLPKAPLPGTVVPVATATGAPGTADPAAGRYSACTIGTPLDDQVFPNTNSVGASVQVSPGLRLGDRVEVQLDGVPVSDWPPTSTSYFLNNLFRGTHNLLAVIRDATGRALCSGPLVKFHVTQPSVRTPVR
jgi:Domain of unknown function (DUF4124)